MSDTKPNNKNSKIDYSFLKSIKSVKEEHKYWEVLVQKAGVHFTSFVSAGFQRTLSADLWFTG